MKVMHCSGCGYERPVNDSDIEAEYVSCPDCSSDMRRREVFVNKTRCLSCNHPITWAEQKKQFGRLVRKGLSSEQAKRLLPWCGKCVTNALAREPIPS